MPRNASGVYSQPAGTTAVSGQTASSAKYNELMTDLGNEITGSLPRNGSAAMTAPLEAASGTVSAPGYTWSAETNSGWYRIGSANFGFSIGGTKVVDLTATVAAFSQTSMTVNGGTVWHTGNDGPGSGLDADTLDGSHASAFGDASGPGSSTDNAIARYDGAGGKTLQNSGVTIDDSDNVKGAATVEAEDSGTARIRLDADSTQGVIGYSDDGSTWSNLLRVNTSTGNVSIGSGGPQASTSFRVSGSTFGISLEKTRSATDARQHVMQDVGGLTTDTAGAFWRGFALRGPALTQSSVSRTPNMVMYYEFDSLTDPTTRRFVFKPASLGSGVGADVLFATQTGGDAFKLEDSGNIKFYETAEFEDHVTFTQNVGTETADFSVSSSHRDQLTNCNHASTAIDITLPSNSTTALDIGFEAHFYRGGAAAVAFVAGSGATVNSLDSALSFAGQYAVNTAKKTGTNEWLVFGALA